MENNNNKRFTSAGTDIEEVKKRNAQVGQDYSNQTSSYETDPQKVKEEIAQEAGPFPSSSQSSAGKTATGTDIAEVKRQNQKSSKNQ